VKITTVGIDLAQDGFQVHGTDERGKAKLKAGTAQFDDPVQACCAGEADVSPDRVSHLKVATHRLAAWRIVLIERLFKAGTDAAIIKQHRAGYVRSCIRADVQERSAVDLLEQVETSHDSTLPSIGQRSKGQWHGLCV